MGVRIFINIDGEEVLSWIDTDVNRILGDYIVSYAADDSNVTLSTLYPTKKLPVTYIVNGEEKTEFALADVTSTVVVGKDSRVSVAIQKDKNTYVDYKRILLNAQELESEAEKTDAFAGNYTYILTAPKSSDSLTVELETYELTTDEAKVFDFYEVAGTEAITVKTSEDRGIGNLIDNGNACGVNTAMQFIVDIPENFNSIRVGLLGDSTGVWSFRGSMLNIQNGKVLLQYPATQRTLSQVASNLFTPGSSVAIEFGIVKCYADGVYKYDRAYVKAGKTINDMELVTWYAPHSKCGRDLVREFVNACNKEGIIPFFYHTLLDWWHVDFNADFPKYLEYLRASVEILCKNYGKIGGIWFDGMWAKPEDDWEEDALYGLIRKYQPEAMIINNTGLNARGALGHIELDSVTFERGKPQPINMEGAPKYIASEMCQVFCDHWGYAQDDLNYKAPGQMIRELADCRRYHSNMLMNVGPMRDGSIRDIDKATLNVMGRWVAYFDEVIREPEPTNIVVEGKPDDFVLKHGKNYYLFCYNLPMIADANVAIFENTTYDSVFQLKGKIQSVKWMDNSEDVAYKQDGENVTITTVPFSYGRNLVVRVAKIVCE